LLVHRCSRDTGPVAGSEAATEVTKGATTSTSEAEFMLHRSRGGTKDTRATSTFDEVSLPREFKLTEWRDECGCKVTLGLGPATDGRYMTRCTPDDLEGPAKLATVLVQVQLGVVQLNGIVAKGSTNDVGGCNGNVDGEWLAARAVDAPAEHGASICALSQEVNSILNVGPFNTGRCGWCTVEDDGEAEDRATIGDGARLDAGQGSRCLTEGLAGSSAEGGGEGDTHGRQVASERSCTVKDTDDTVEFRDGLERQLN
jgi:hypothetical protein